MKIFALTVRRGPLGVKKKKKKKKTALFASIPETICRCTTPPKCCFWKSTSEQFHFVILRYCPNLDQTFYFFGQVQFFHALHSAALLCRNIYILYEDTSTSTVGALKCHDNVKFIFSTHEIMIPLSMEKLSDGSPAMVHARIFTGSPSEFIRDMLGEHGISLLLQRFIHSSVWSCRGARLVLINSFSFYYKRTNTLSLTCKTNNVYKNVHSNRHIIEGTVCMYTVRLSLFLA